jgi:hypothetical protein
MSDSHGGQIKVPAKFGSAENVPTGPFIANVTWFLTRNSTKCIRGSDWPMEIAPGLFVLTVWPNRGQDGLLCQIDVLYLTTEEINPWRDSVLETDKRDELRNCASTTTPQSPQFWLCINEVGLELPQLPGFPAGKKGKKSKNRKLRGRIVD